MLSGEGDIKIISMFFVRARMSAGEFWCGEDSMFQDRTYRIVFQNTTCRSAATDLACEIVEDLS